MLIRPAHKATGLGRRNAPAQSSGMRIATPRRTDTTAVMPGAVHAAMQARVDRLILVPLRN